MLKKTGFVLGLLIFSSAHAESYGMAGCGLGSLVFKDQPGMIQIVASTVNNLVSPQTFAISSGTSGCYDGGGMSAMKLRYIETNKVALKEDAARGQGETLDGLMTLMGCTEGQKVKSQIKKNYDSIFNSQDSQTILEKIQSDEAVQNSCQTIG